MKFNKLIPELAVSDFSKSLEFYKMLGFKVEYSRKDFAFLSFEGSQTMIQQANDAWKTAELIKPYGRGINFQIEVKNVEKLLNLIKENNYPIAYQLKENEYEVKGEKTKQKEFLIKDLDGYLLRFCQEIKKQ
jgi:hypothetical protein